MLEKLIEMINDLIKEISFLEPASFNFNNASILTCLTFKPTVQLKASQQQKLSQTLKKFLVLLKDLQNEGMGKKTNDNTLFHIITSLHKVMVILTVANCSHEDFKSILAIISRIRSHYALEIMRKPFLSSYMLLSYLELMNLIEFEFRECIAEVPPKEMATIKNSISTAVHNATLHHKSKLINYLTSLVGLYLESVAYVKVLVKNLLQQKSPSLVKIVCATARLRCAELCYKSTELLMPYSFINNSRENVVALLYEARSILANSRVSIVYYYYRYHQFCSNMLTMEAYHLEKYHYSIHSTLKKQQPLEVTIGDEWSIDFSYNQSQLTPDIRQIMNKMDNYLKCKHDCIELLNFFENASVVERIAICNLWFHMGYNMFCVIGFAHGYFEEKGLDDLLSKKSSLIIINFLEDADKMIALCKKIITNVAESHYFNAAAAVIAKSMLSKLNAIDKSFSSYMKKLSLLLEKKETDQAIAFHELTKEMLRDKNLRENRLKRRKRNASYYTKKEIETEKVLEKSDDHVGEVQTIARVEFKEALDSFIKGDFQDCIETLTFQLNNHLLNELQQVKAFLLLGDAEYAMAKKVGNLSNYISAIKGYEAAKTVSLKYLDKDKLFRPYYDMALLSLSQKVSVVVKNDLIPEIFLPGSVFQFSAALLGKGYRVFIAGSFLLATINQHDASNINLIIFLSFDRLKMLFPEFSIQRTKSELPVCMIDLGDQTIGAYCCEEPFSVKNLQNIAKSAAYTCDTLYLCLKDYTFYDALGCAIQAITSRTVDLIDDDYLETHPEKIWYAIVLCSKGYELSNMTRKMISKNYSLLRNLDEYRNISALEKVFYGNDIKKIFDVINVVEPSLLALIFPKPILSLWKSNSVVQDCFWGATKLFEQHAVLPKNRFLVFLGFLYVVYIYHVMKKETELTQIKKIISELFFMQEKLFNMPPYAVETLQFCVVEIFNQFAYLYPLKSIYPQQVWISSIVKTTFEGYKHSLINNANLIDNLTKEGYSVK